MCWKNAWYERRVLMKRPQYVLLMILNIILIGSAAQAQETTLEKCNFWLGVTRDTGLYNVLHVIGNCLKNDWSTPQIVQEQPGQRQGTPVPDDWSKGVNP